MKNSISILGLLFFCVGSIFAQQGLFEIRPYTPATGKKAAYYKRHANSQVKKESYRAACLEAIQWVNQETKKKKQEKAKAELASILPLCMEKSAAEADMLKERTAAFKGVTTVTDLATLKALYQELEAIRESHGQLSTNLQIASNGLATSYQQDIATTDSQLKEARTKAAEMLYQQALDLEASKTQLLRTDYLEIAKTLARIPQYAQNYKDTKERYAAAKQKGTIYLAVAPFANETSYRAASTSDLRSYVIRETQKQLVQGKYIYISILSADQHQSNKANVRMELAFGSNGIERQYEEPYSREKKRTVEEGEAKTQKTYTGTMTTHRKKGIVTQSVQYRLIDLETGNTLASDMIELQAIAWSEDWYKFSGDMRALKKSEKNRVQNDGKEPAWPSNNELTQLMFNTSTIKNTVSQIILDLAKKEGR